MRLRLLAGLLAIAAGTSVLARQSTTALDSAFRTFWNADSPAAAEKAINGIVATGASFDQVLARLKAGRTYQRQPAGRVALPSRIHGVALDNAVEVPESYDPQKPMALRVSLHGGVGRPAPGPGDDDPRPLTNRIPGNPELVIHPRAWGDSPWWIPEQVENIHKLVDTVKRRYNVDEARTYITGISDGGTGVYFFGMRAATLWAACLPLNGHPAVLANPQTGADGELFAANLANCPLHAVNGGKDRLYPAAGVEPIVNMFRKGGIPILWQVFPDADHNTEWWPDEKARYTGFLAEHPRVAHPETVTWETERTDRYNRFRWVVIDQLGKRPSDASLPDVNLIETDTVRRPFFSRQKPSGRVDVTRKGNDIDVKSRGVASLTLLLSPDVIDFSRTVRVTANGRPVHNAVVKPNLATLLEWASRDNDRTMVYGAELKVAIP